MMRYSDARRPFATARQGQDDRRELRIPVSLESVLGNTQTGKRKVELQDISCLGCRVNTVLSLAVGNYVVITMPSLAPIGAQVRWRTHEGLGLRFNAALHPMVVRRIEAYGRPQ
jgi:hypothetical protein